MLIVANSDDRTDCISDEIKNDETKQEDNDNGVDALDEIVIIRNRKDSFDSSESMSDDSDLDLVSECESSEDDYSEFAGDDDDDDDPDDVDEYSEFAGDDDDDDVIPDKDKQDIHLQYQNSRLQQTLSKNDNTFEVLQQRRRRRRHVDSDDADSIADVDVIADDFLPVSSHLEDKSITAELPHKRDDVENTDATEISNSTNKIEEVDDDTCQEGHVHFCPIENNTVFIYGEDIDRKEYIEDLWYSKTDYFMIRKHNKKLVRLYQKGSIEFDDTANFRYTLRGLENRFNRSVYDHERLNIRINSIHSVLMTQQQQKNSKTSRFGRRKSIATMVLDDRNRELKDSMHMNKASFSRSSSDTQYPFLNDSFQSNEQQEPQTNINENKKNAFSILDLAIYERFSEAISDAYKNNGATFCQEKAVERGMSDYFQSVQCWEIKKDYNEPINDKLDDGNISSDSCRSYDSSDSITNLRSRLRSSGRKMLERASSFRRRKKTEGEVEGNEETGKTEKKSTKELDLKSTSNEKKDLATMSRVPRRKKTSISKQIQLHEQKKDRHTQAMSSRRKKIKDQPEQEPDQMFLSHTILMH